MSRVLNGRSIVITGASSGIGAATAIACAEAGMDIVINARREERLACTAREIEARGRRCAMVIGDVAEAGVTDRLLDAAEHELGGIYAVFANAGYGTEKPMHVTSMDEIRAMFEVNLFAGVELLSEAANRLLRAEKPGHLLMCSSCLSKFSLPLHGSYAATKAAQDQICRAMHYELRAADIEVSSVHPVTTTTEFFDVSAQRSGRESAAELMAKRTPRLMRQPPERVARAIVKCLERPRPEVWTSFIVRAFAGAITVFPGLGEVFIRRTADRELLVPPHPREGVTSAFGTQGEKGA